MPTGSHKVRCARCDRMLLESHIEAVEDSRVWLRTRCKDRGCRAFNVVLYVNGKYTVSLIS